MMEKYTLNAEQRNVFGKKVKNLRLLGKIPAVIYGGKDKPVSISIDARTFHETYKTAGTSSIIDLIIGDKEKTNVLMQEPQYNPVTGNIIHVDFIRVRMDEKIKTEIPIQFNGESPAVEQEGGTLVTPRDNIEVECLPKDLVHEIIVDIARLVNFDSQIKVSDITPPPGIEFLTDPEEVLATVEPPRSEEELAELEKPTAEQEKEAVEAVAGAKDEEAEESTEGESTPDGTKEVTLEDKTDQKTDKK